MNVFILVICRYRIPMDFKTYAATVKSDLPPNLDAGMEFGRIDRVEANTFEYEGNTVKGMRIFTDKGEFKTSSGVIIDILGKYFAVNKEPLTNVKVVAPRGKRYLTLESI